jgi:hypothetical protein
MFLPVLTSLNFLQVEMGAGRRRYNLALFLVGGLSICGMRVSARSGITASDWVHRFGTPDALFARGVEIVGGTW